MAKSLTIHKPARWPGVSFDWDGLLGEAWAKVNRLASVLGADLATIFFVPLPWFGVVLWAAIAQNDPRYAAFGLLGLGAGFFVARVLGVADIPMLGGGIKANALLTALAAGWLTIPVPMALQAKILVATVSALAAGVITAALIRALVRSERRRFRPYRAGNGCSEEGGYGMPSLASGYCVVAGAMFVLFPAWTSIAVSVTPAWTIPVDLVSWLVAFLRSLGSLLFSPTVEVGVMVAGALLLWSRTLFVTGTVGWICGAYTALIIQGMGTEFYWLPASYNFFLTGMALGAVFLLPGRMSLLLAAIGGCAAAIFAAVLQHVAPSWAYLPISSVLAIWVGLGGFTISEERTRFWRNYARRFPPEEAWWREANWAKRFGRRDPLLVVPVPGLVQVSQGFDGKLSHAGRWCHALDLQRPPAMVDAAAASIWGVPVTAPAAGVVERVRDNVADNPLGICNYADNWGNYVVIRLDQGGWALLGHLREKSITVSAGTRVEIGSYVGEVGNSGRSPIPHLHLQMQRAADPGAPTIPFRIANYQSVDASPDAALRWNAMSVPAEKAIVAASAPNAMMRSILASLAPGVAIWTLETEGHIPYRFRPHRSGRTTQIQVRMDPAGQHLFTAGAAQAMVCSIDPDAWRVLEVTHAVPPLLRLIALGAPSIPYAARVGMVWHELVPVNAIEPGWLGLAMLPYAGQPFAELRCVCRTEPGSPHEPVVIDSTATAPRAGMPLRITTQFEVLRGPVKVEAIFAEGRVVYSLLSFEPSIPFREA